MPFDATTIDHQRLAELSLAAYYRRNDGTRAGDELDVAQTAALVGIGDTLIALTRELTRPQPDRLEEQHPTTDLEVDVDLDDAVATLIWHRRYRDLETDALRLLDQVIRTITNPDPYIDRHPATVADLTDAAARLQKTIERNARQ